MQPYPLEFRPLLKQTIWGGRRLGTQLGKPIGPESDYAESWELVDHGADQSVVLNGPLAGLTLAALLQRDRRWLMGTAPPGESFPLLLKYLDCNRVLSVQVHPDDQYAAAMETPDLGKTEAWYVVAAGPESRIYAGLKSGIDRDDFQAAMAAGRTEEVLHWFHPRPGDVLFIPAGTVHALGAGLLVAEIQQSSNTTFRLFDWNRLDADGNARPLHLRQGLEVTDYDTGPVAPRHCDPIASGWQTMVECDKFNLAVLSGGEAKIAGDGKFHIITVPRGPATLLWSGGRVPMAAGATLLLPAAMGACDVVVEAGGMVLAADLPD